MRCFTSILPIAVFVFAISVSVQGKVNDAEIASIRVTTEPKSRTLLTLDNLPAALDDRDQFTWLVSQLDLESLDKSHVGLMTTSELRLEEAFRTTRLSEGITMQMQISLLSGIVLRIETLLLGDNQAFRKSREGIITGMGFRGHFQALSEWCRAANIETEAAALITHALEGPKQQASAELITNPVMEKNSSNVDLQNKAPISKPATQQEAAPQSESKSWLVWLLMVIAATSGAACLLLRKRK